MCLLSALLCGITDILRVRQAAAYRISLLYHQYHGFYIEESLAFTIGDSCIRDIYVAER